MKRINYSEIARQANISRQFMSNILAGRKRASWITAKKLAEITDSLPTEWMDSDPNRLKQIITNFQEATHDR